MSDVFYYFKIFFILRKTRSFMKNMTNKQNELSSLKESYLQKKNI